MCVTKIFAFILTPEHTLMKRQVSRVEMLGMYSSLPAHVPKKSIDNHKNVSQGTNRLTKNMLILNGSKVKARVVGTIYSSSSTVGVGVTNYPVLVVEIRQVLDNCCKIAAYV